MFGLVVGLVEVPPKMLVPLKMPPPLFDEEPVRCIAAVMRFEPSPRRDVDFSHSPKDLRPTFVPNRRFLSKHQEV